MQQMSFSREALKGFQTSQKQNATEINPRLWWEKPVQSMQGQAEEWEAQNGDRKKKQIGESGMLLMYTYPLLKWSVCSMSELQDFYLFMQCVWHNNRLWNT